MSCDVFILAAGLGTRLRPLTLTVPKPLVEVNGKPLIAYHLERLAKEGFTRVMINLHYLPDKIKDFVGDGDKWGIKASFSFEPDLLDTGGGIKNVEKWYHAEQILVLNSDSLFDSSLSLKELLNTHLATKAEMTLLVGEESQAFTPLWVSENSKLVGFIDPPLDPTGAHRVSYLGAMVISRSLLKSMPAKGTPFSITAGVIPKLLAGAKTISTLGYRGYWNDIGTPERLNEASKYFVK